MFAIAFSGRQHMKDPSVVDSVKKFGSHYEWFIRKGVKDYETQWIEKTGEAIKR